MCLVFHLNSSKILAIHIRIFFFHGFSKNYTCILSLSQSTLSQYCTALYLLFVVCHIIQLCDRINHFLPLSFVLLLSHVLLFHSVNSPLPYKSMYFLHLSFRKSKRRKHPVFFFNLLTYLPLLFDPSLRSEIQFVASSLSFDELPLTFLEMKV